MRLPELFCGFRRKGPDAPLQFPGRLFAAGLLGGRHLPDAAERAWHLIDALDRQIVLAHPVVPEGFEEISVRNFFVEEASVDFTVRRHGASVSVSVERREGKVDLVIRS